MNFESYQKALFAAAKTLGCAAAETYFVEGEEFEVRVLKQEVDSYSVKRTMGLGLRVQADGKDGYAYTEVFEDAEGLVRRALDNAAVIESGDEHPLQTPQTYEPLTLPENPVLAYSEAEKIELALRLERAALAADPRVDRVSYDIVATERARVCIDNTLGLHAEQEDHLSYCLVAPVLQKDGEVHDAHEFYTNADTARVEDCARAAVAKAAAQFGAKPVPPGNYRVLWQNEAAADLLSAFSPMFSADNAQKGLSVLAGKLGTQIVSSDIRIVDDPLYPKFPRAFDAEGTPSRRTAVVEDGTLKSFLHNLKTAKKDRVESTSNASRPSAASPVGIAPSHFYIAPGSKSFEELMAELGDGLLVTDLSGLHSGANAVSGEFSLLAKGMLVEKGRPVRAVEQITVAGTFLGMLSDVLAVGSDLQFGIPSDGCVGSPSILVKSVAVAGK